MRIVQLVTKRERRGAEVFAAQLSDRLVARGHDALLVGIYPHAGDLLTPSVARSLDLQTASRHKLSGARVSELAQRLRDLEPDVVQANGSDTLKYAVLAKLKLGATWPLVYRNIGIASHWLHFPGQRMWIKWLVRQVDHVAAVSDRSGGDFQKMYGVPSTRLSTVPNGAAIPAFFDRSQARARLLHAAGVAADQRVLINVASFTPEKNQLWLIEAFEQLHAIQKRITLVLVGDGPTRSECEQLVARKQLQSVIHFLGSRPDAADLMGGADLVLLSSKIEGIPGVILEAAARGVTCVATDVGSTAEAVDNGRTGVLVPLDARLQFIAAIIDLLRDEDRRERMGRAARDYVRARFDIARVVESFEALYCDLVAPQTSHVTPREEPAALLPPA